jgi:hypothetical protein
MACVRSAPGVLPPLSFWARVGVRVQRLPGSLPRAWERGAPRLAGLVGVLVCLLPGWALACPACVERAPESVGRSALLLGAMLLVPFLLVAGGVWAAVRAARGDAKRSP